MMFEPWILIALLYTFFAAAYSMTNDVFKQDGPVVVYWRSLLSAVVTLPFALFADWPTDINFYLLIFLSAAMAGVGDIYMFQGFKQYGGAAISRMGGFRPMLMFVLWFFFDPKSWQQLQLAPVVTGAIFVCLCVTAYALFSARHNHISRAAFKAFLPCIFLFTFCDIATKLALGDTPANMDTLIVLFFFSSCIIATITGGVMKFTGEKRIIVPEKLWLTASINASIVIIIVMLKTYGLSITPNPSYFTALALVSTVWTYLAHRFIFRQPDDASPRAGFMVVLSAAVLTILVGMLPK